MTSNPLTGPPPTEVPLPRAPLVRVLAQVRFPVIVSVEQESFIASFQEAIRTEYGVMRPTPSQSLVLRHDGSHIEVRAKAAWRFHDPRHDAVATLSTDFLTLETSRYTSRHDFFARFGRLLHALGLHIRPTVFDRLGVRYISRVTGAPLGDLTTFFRPELLGALTTPVGNLALLAVSESLYELPEESGQLRARWGVVPPQTTLDPQAIDAVNERSWVLDHDAFVEREHAFNADEITAQAIRLAERCYAMFRWSVTDHFLRHFGGMP